MHVLNLFTKDENQNSGVFTTILDQQNVGSCWSSYCHFVNTFIQRLRFHTMFMSMLNKTTTILKKYRFDGHLGSDTTR